MSDVRVLAPVLSPGEKVKGPASRGSKRRTAWATGTPTRSSAMSARSWSRRRGDMNDRGTPPGASTA
jgi:hypothetical protein